jgi:hypothetical protein
MGYPGGIDSPIFNLLDILAGGFNLSGWFSHQSVSRRSAMSFNA